LALVGDLLIYAGPSGPFDYTGASFEAAMSLQAEVTDEWLARDGVVGTAIGVDGVGHAVLKVYLTAPGLVSLPQSMSGVAVVPEVTGRFMALGGVASDAESRVDRTASFPRPVPIGVSTGHQDVTAGTIGARVTDGTRTFALSNNHIFAANNGGRAGDELLQPGVVDGGRAPADVIGTLYDYEPLRFCRGFSCEANTIDAAIALTTPDDLGGATPEEGYGAPRSWTVEADLGLKVQKYGRTTGYTKGRVSGLHATIDVGYSGGTARFEDQIVISGSGFSAGGDSGSLIVTDGLLLADRRPVGLLFAGTPTTTVANPIDLVLDRFGVTVDGG
jgi:Peptidase family S64